MLDYFELGRILKPQGIRGEVKAEFYTDDISRIDDLDSVYFKEHGVMVKKDIVSARTDGSFGYILLEGVTDRNAAESLRNTVFYVDRAHAAPLEPGSYYIADLIGLDVLDDAGRNLGKVSDIIQNGCTDVYCVNGDRPFMFPGIKEVFAERSPEKGVIVLVSGKLAEIAVYDI